MTLFTTDYLEYYLTLVGWIVHNGIWSVLVASGVFAIPFIAIILQEWLKARGEGADEGNKGLLSAARVERTRRRARGGRAEEHTSELQSLMRLSYAVFGLKKKNIPIP